MEKGNFTISRRNLLTLAALGLVAPSSLKATWAAARQNAKITRKRALLIAVQYPPHPDSDSNAWRTLSTESDRKHIQEALIDIFGFKEENITVLNTQAKTTRQAIEDAITQFINETKPGDIVYINFSGHGSTAPNPAKPDGQDATIIPSDSKGTHDSSNDIRSTKIKAWLATLSQRAAHIFVTFDCCHAGGNTRGRAKVRGFTSVDLPPTNGVALIDSEPQPTGYIVMQACRKDQVDTEVEVSETESMGGLSYAFVTALRKVGKDTSYRVLRAEIEAIMTKTSPGQTPQMEGIVDEKVLDGAALHRPTPAIAVTLDNTEPGHSTLQLQAGLLMGLGEGSVVELFPAEEQKFAENTGLAQAKLVHVDAVDSDLEVLPGGKKTEAEILAMLKGGKPNLKSGSGISAVQAIVRRRAYSMAPLLVDMSPLEKHPLYDKIMEPLKELEGKKLIKYQGVSAKSKWDVQAVKVDPNVALRGEAPHPNGLLLSRADGSPITFAPVPDQDLPAAVQGALMGEARRRLFASIENNQGNSQMKVEFRWVLVEAKPTGRQRQAQYLRDKQAVPPTRGNTLTLRVGDYVVLEVRNIGTVPAYVTVLDMQPDGEISPIWPQPTIETNNLLLVDNTRKPEDRPWYRPLLPDGKTPYMFQISEPVGLETYRAIATLEKRDFAILCDKDSIQRGRSRGAKEAESALGSLLLMATSDTRDAKFASVPPAEWATVTLNITILPK